MLEFQHAHTFSGSMRRGLGGGVTFALVLSATGCDPDVSRARQWISDVRSALGTEDIDEQNVGEGPEGAPIEALASDVRADRLGQILEAANVQFWEALPEEAMSEFMKLLPEDGPEPMPEAGSAEKVAAFLEASEGLEPDSAQAGDLKESMLNTGVVVEESP